MPSGALERREEGEPVDQSVTLRPGLAGGGVASGPVSLVGVTNLRVPIPGAEFGLRVWEDPRRIGGLDLRYWLIRQIHTRPRDVHTVAGLVEQLHTAGFTVRGRESKTVSDALATETTKGRIIRTGWGRYRAGLSIPKTTWWRICNRTGVVQRALDNQLRRIAERYFHHWKYHAPIPANRIARLWETVGGPHPHIKIRLAPRTLPDPAHSSGRRKVAAVRNSTQKEPSPSSTNPRPNTLHPRTLVGETQPARTARATSPHFPSAEGFWRSSSSRR